MTPEDMARSEAESRLYLKIILQEAYDRIMDAVADQAIDGPRTTALAMTMAGAMGRAITAIGTEQAKDEEGGR